MKEIQISVVIPFYNEDESLPELLAWVERVMNENKFTYEIIMVDDGSTDNSWAVVEKLATINPFIKAIKFRRNYGKSAALNVAFQKVQGNVVITMDADMQDSPDEIPSLYNMVTNDGFDLVSGWKKKRYDPITKTIPTKIFNWATRKMSGIELNDFNCGLKAYKVDVVKAIEVYNEMHRYIPVLAKWNGFTKIAEKEVVHRARKYGITKFGFSRFVNGFLDLLTIFFVSKFGKKPMHFFGVLGMLFFIFGMGSTVYIIFQKFWYASHNWAYGRSITEQPMFYLALVAIIIGVQLFLAGFIGELISRNSTERNHYGITKYIGYND